MNYFYGTDAYPTITEMGELAPSVGGAAAASNPWLSLMANPMIQTTLLNFAQALDPKGFGGQLADSTRQAIQASQTAKANAMATGVGATNAQVPKPAVTAPAGNPGTAPSTPNPGDGLKKLGTFMNDALAIDPSLVPSNYVNSFTNALNSQPITNPTEAADSQIAGQPSTAMNPVQPFEVPFDSAFAMSPEQVQNVYTHKLNVQKVANETRAQNNADASLPTEISYKQAATDKLRWDIDPQRVEDQIRVNREQVMSYLELHKGKQQFDVQMANDFNSKFPGLAKTKIPFSNMTYGQAITTAAYNPQGAQNITALINSGLDYRAAITRANTDLEATKIRAAADGKTNDVNKAMLAYEKLNKDVLHYSSDIPLDEWKEMTPEKQREAIALGRNPRTPERQQALEYAITMRDNIGQQLMPNAYAGLKSAEDKAVRGTTSGIQQELSQLPTGYTAQTDLRAPGSESKPFTLRVDPNKLAEVERSVPPVGGSTGKKREASASMWQMFNPFYSGGKS